MSIELVILGLSVNQISALRAMPALTADVTGVAQADQFWAETLASMQDDDLKERREGIKARIVRSMSPGERAAFEARLTHEDQVFVQTWGSPQDRKERDSQRLKSMSPEEREDFENQQRRWRESRASSLDHMLEDERRIDESRARIAGIGVLEEPLDLGKNYRDLHYAFTGHSVDTTDPSDAPGDALMTGEYLGKNLVYDPARLHDVAATREFARFLNGLDLAQPQARLDRAWARMSDGVTDHRILELLNGQRALEFRHASFSAVFLALRDYVTRMAEQQFGLLIWLT
jgi:hypothetical protein